MALKFEEQALTASGNTYKQLKLNDLPIGKSVYFFKAGVEPRTSEAFGDFELLVGLEVDADKANDAKDLPKLSELASFIPNTMLQNANLQDGVLYRIEKAWNRGDKGQKGKPAKGFGFKVFALGIDATTKAQLLAKFGNVDPQSNIEVEAAPWDAKPRL